jgi:hypothetical protein
MAHSSLLDVLACRLVNSLPGRQGGRSAASAGISDPPRREGTKAATSDVRVAKYWATAASLGTAAAAFGASAAAMLDPPPLCDGGHLYGVAQGYNCADYQPHDQNNPEVPSIGWWGRLVHATSCNSPPSAQLLGFPLNVDLIIGVTPPDLPPRTRSLPLGSSPLVPAVPVVPHRPVHRWERPVLAESVDLVTGIPLVQEVDLELPFGSATYRHLRTYSERPPSVHESGCYEEWIKHYPDAYFWDWQGQGWMMGEAPLFLIDAAYNHAVWTDEDSPRRCYFIPDAHHAIPFIFDEIYGEYVAPPHCDAYLRHNGDGYFDDIAKEWVWNQRPSVFRVSLHDGAIHYTIRAIYGDVYPGYLTDGYSDNATPDTGNPSGYVSPGAPYWGLVERIDDAFGNSIDIEYCTFHQTEYDRSSTNDCTECLQNTHEKGQIKRVRLIAGVQLDPFGDWGNLDWDAQTQDGEVAWTLLYVYRSFAPEETDESLLNFPFHRQTALHELRVYEGERAALSDCATLHYSQFIGMDYKGPAWSGLPTQLDAIEALASVPALPNDWTHRLSYVYAEPNPMLGPSDDTELYRRLYEYSCPYPAYSPRLMKSTVAQRIDLDDGSSQIHEEYALYRYDAAGASPDIGREGTHNGEDLVVLRDIYRHARITEALAQLNEDPSLPSGEFWTVNHLAQGWGPGTWDMYAPPERPLDDELFTVQDSGGTGEMVNVPWTELPGLSLFHWGDLDCAVFYRDNRFGAWGTDCGPDERGFEHSDFAKNMFNGYAGVDVTKSGFLNQGVAVVAQRGEGSGQNRFYKLYRFQQAPKVLDSGRTEFIPASYMDNVERALFREPYRFLREGGLDDLHDAIVPLHHALWITVIDEYETIADCEVIDSAEWTDAKVPLSRRVLHMGAAGFVQFEKEWRRVWDDATGAYVLEPGDSAGMREEYVYDKFGRLKEHRTFGWGTSENTLPADEGLVNVFEYDAPYDSNDDDDFYDKDDKLPLEVIAKGLKRGTTYEPGLPDADTIWWLEAHERHPDKPELVTRQLKLREPLTDLQNANTGNADITEVEYEFDTTSGAPEEWRIKRKTIRGQEVAIDGVDYRLTETVWHDVGRDAQDKPIGTGQVEWRGYGLVSADGVVGGGEAFERFFFDYWRYDDKGRLIRAVFDAVSGEALGNVVSNHTGQEVQPVPDPPTIPGYPDGLPRVAPGGALSLMEKYHHGTWGPVIAEHTNGRQTIYSYSRNGEGEFVKRT